MDAPLRGHYKYLVNRHILKLPFFPGLQPLSWIYACLTIHLETSTGYFGTTMPKS